LPSSQRHIFTLAVVSLLLLSAVTTLVGSSTNASPDTVRSNFANAERQIVTVSSDCASGANAEVEQAVDTSAGYVYEEWMGCRGIAFARSTDGGHHFDAPISLPGTVGSNVNVWDPALAVAPDGTVYAAFMRAKNSQWFPVVAASFDHGQTFSQVSNLVPPNTKNWGDREFLAVAPNGTVYLTYDYGPERTSVNFICTTGGSCAFATGDLNVVIQWSKDQGKTWSSIVPVSPGFPASGGDSAPILIEPNGRIDVLYQGYHITNTTTYTMDPAHTYFTSSVNGRNWTTPVQVGPSQLTMSLAEWWIDGSLGTDTAGNLYATWDTQGKTDIGWLSYSTDHGRDWSPLVQVTPDRNNATHIMEVAGGGSGIAYVGWLSNNSTQRWAMYLRVFTISTGSLGSTILVSSHYGDPSIWPGDTFGISTLNNMVVLSWGSGIRSNGVPKSEISESLVSFV
jgi:hypothetical protein